MPHPGARFSDPAELYDLVYQFKDYRSEAARVAELLAREGVEAGSRVLEAACGTGSYLAWLEGFERVGFDLDPAMLRLAKARLPGARLFVADMADFAVEEPVDAALLLFGGIGYTERLDDTLRCLAASLRPGGVLLLEPWVTPERFQPGLPWMVVYETRFLKVCRQCIPRREGGRSVLDFHFLVARPGFQPEHIVTTEALWLRDIDEQQEALARHFTEVRLSEEGFMEDRLLFTCRKG